MHDMKNVNSVAVFFKSFARSFGLNFWDVRPFGYFPDHIRDLSLRVLFRCKLVELSKILECVLVETMTQCKVIKAKPIRSQIP